MPVCGGCLKGDPDRLMAILRDRRLVAQARALPPMIPSRRCRIDLLVPGEKAIYDAVAAVERMGADVRLTHAVVLLGKARDFVADFVENVPLAQELEGVSGQKPDQEQHHTKTDKPGI